MLPPRFKAREHGASANAASHEPDWVGGWIGERRRDNVQPWLCASDAGVNTLWRVPPASAYRQAMQQQPILRNQKSAAAMPSVVLSDASRAEIARRAYLTYRDEGSMPGREEQHWLEAEARLHAEIIHGGRHHSA